MRRRRHASIFLLVKPVRVLLDGLPQLLHGIISEALAERCDVELVSGESPLSRDGVDVVLTGAADPHDVRKATALLEQWPRSRILVVASSGRHAVMYEWHPRKLALGDVSPRSLARAICQGFGARVM